MNNFNQSIICLLDMLEVGITFEFFVNKLDLCGLVRKNVCSETPAVGNRTGGGGAGLRRGGS